jgi:hypothetical protein
MMLTLRGLGLNEYGTYIQDTPVGGVQTVNAYSGAAVPWWCSFWTFADACHPTGIMPVSKPIAPVAPQTQGQMTTPGAWTPAEASAWSAYVQGQVRSAEQGVYEANAADQSSGSGTGTPAEAAASSNTPLLIVAGVAVLGLVLALRK